MKHGDRVEINWIDSVSDMRNWIDEEEFDFDSHDKSMYYKSVGIFIRKTKVATYFCESIRICDDSGGSNIGHVMSIPNRAIISIEVI